MIDEETGKTPDAEPHRASSESLPDVVLDLDETVLPKRPEAAATGRFEIAKSEPMRVFDRTLRIPSPIPNTIPAQNAANVTTPIPQQDFSKTIPLSEWQSALGPTPHGPEPEPEPEPIEDGQRTIMKPLRALLPVPHVEFEGPTESRLAADDGATRNVPIDEIIRRRKQVEAAKTPALANADKPAEGAARTGFADKLRSISWISWLKYAAVATLAVLGIVMLLPNSPEPVAKAPSTKPAATVARPSSAADPAKLATATSPVSIIPSVPTEAQNSREQREAIDALVAGDLARAVAVYEKLAVAHPKVPAYREAARILKEKAQRR
jgi:hypothetical protein